MFESNINGTQEMSEASAHELGHAVDFYFNLQSSSSTYGAFAQNDFLNLDYTVVGATQATSTPRAACSSNGSAPLDNVIDESTSLNYCDPNSHQLESQYVIGGVQQHISKILGQVDDGLFNFNPVSWFEIYPQVFAYIDYVNGNLTPSQYLKPTMDGLLANSRLPCLQLWAIALVAGNFTPPASAPSSCSSTVPAWYTPGQ